MCKLIFSILKFYDLIRVKTGLSVLARWTNADAFVLTILEGSQVHASELGVSEPTKSQLS